MSGRICNFGSFTSLTLVIYSVSRVSLCFYFFFHFLKIMGSVEGQ